MSPLGLVSAGMAMARSAGSMSRGRLSSARMLIPPGLVCDKVRNAFKEGLGSWAEPPLTSQTALFG
jgi:hypothetical protein